MSQSAPCLLSLLVWAWMFFLHPVARAEPARALHYFDIPPMMYTDAQGRAAGTVVERLRKSWPSELTMPPLVAAPLKRSIHDVLVAGEPICLVGVFKTPEREAAAWFSSPIFRESPSVFVATKAAAERLRRYPSAQALIEDPASRLLLTDGASYGPQLDAWLLRRGSGGVLRVAAPPARQILMLLRGHADLMFSDLEQALQLLKGLGSHAKQLELLQLPGMAESPTRHLMCERHLDRQWLEALDEGLKALDAGQAFTP